MSSKKKISLLYQNEKIDNGDTQEDLHMLLENSQYQKSHTKMELFKKKVKKESSPEKVEFQNEKTGQNFNRVYELIQQMRKNRNAPVDTDGPHALFDKKATLNDQRFQILIALLISPQTRDEVTGQIMRRLLNLPCTVEKIYTMNEEEIKQQIFETNFNATKAKRITQAAKKIKDELNGQMPISYEEVLKFEGVGEKIALLYSGVALNEWKGIAVDVNLLRVCNRIPIARTESPSKMRKKLEDIVPKEDWENFNETLVGFGQQICRVPGREQCDRCLIMSEGLCEYGKNKQIQIDSKKKKRSNSKAKKNKFGSQESLQY